MKYKPTPLNIACGIGIGISLYYVIKSGGEGWGILVTINLIPFILLGLVVDFLLQKFIPKYFQVFAIELLLLTALYIAYCWTQRTKTLIIPDKRQSQYVATIYGVENSDPLPDGWHYEIKIPTTGILLTSSTFDSDLPETEMLTNTGQKLNTEETKLGWTRVEHSKFECNGKTYEYQLWMVDSSCCSYSNQDIDNFKANIQAQFCRQ